MKAILVLFVLSMSISGLFAQEPVQSAAQDSIVFENLVHDYGTITKGADGNTEFKFTNKGDKPLILSNVRSSCGCTVPSWTKEPVEPGKTGLIKVKYDTKRVGSFSKSITVSSNAVNSRVVLRIKGNVTQKE
ncbi:MAG: DUF1573 domain-containing protein [Prolixibacteraceae bacterium]|jgi:hypothetical protein|nr:DUF1573 domain-containing protein [Prolixibacteraceae bacterium]